MWKEAYFTDSVTIADLADERHAIQKIQGSIIVELAEFGRLSARKTSEEIKAMGDAAGTTPCAYPKYPTADHASRGSLCFATTKTTTT